MTDFNNEEVNRHENGGHIAETRNLGASNGGCVNDSDKEASDQYQQQQQQPQGSQKLRFEMEDATQTTATSVSGPHRTWRVQRPVTRSTLRRKWSSRRRSRAARRQSAFATSEDIDGLNQLTTSASTHRFPPKLHGLIIATIASAVSLSTLIWSIVILIKLFFFSEDSNQSGCVKHENQEKNTSSDIDCTSSSSSSSLEEILNWAVHGGDASRVFERPDVMWFVLGFSMLFLWSAVKLWTGIWYQLRRSLLPWLLVTGVVILFLIMISVLGLICLPGKAKLYALLSIALALLFLYWWTIVNNLLEEIHEDKKALYAASLAQSGDLEAGLSEGIGLTTRGGVSTFSNGSRIRMRN